MGMAKLRRMSRSATSRLPRLDRDEQILDWGPCSYRGDHAIRHQQSLLAGDWFLTTKRFWFVTPASSVEIRHERIRQVETHEVWRWLRTIEITADQVDGTVSHHQISPRRSLGTRLRRALRGRDRARAET